MSMRSRWYRRFPMLRLVLGLCFRCWAEDAVRPTALIKLFDGTEASFTNSFYTWLQESAYQDPKRVFTRVDQIDGEPAIRVSGDGYGGFITRKSYQDYKLSCQWRWGLLTWGDRKTAARDNGILIHCNGADGNFTTSKSEKDFPGKLNASWMRSIEFQIIEGGVGDLLVLNGWTPDGKLLRTKITVRAKKDRDGEWVFDPNAGPQIFENFVRVNWWGRDWDWEDKLGQKWRENLESPEGQWTTLVAEVRGGHLKFFVNGKLANEGTDCNLTQGKLFFQTEAAELYFRRIELEPLPATTSL